MQKYLVVVVLVLVHFLSFGQDLENKWQFSSIKNANGKWYNFNDTIITEIDESKIISSQTYCLFYRKK